MKVFSILLILLLAYIAVSDASPSPQSPDTDGMVEGDSQSRLKRGIDDITSFGRDKRGLYVFDLVQPADLFVMVHYTLNMVFKVLKITPLQLIFLLRMVTKLLEAWNKISDYYRIFAAKTHLNNVLP
ncbi:uncharacterized protein LOC123682471 isoform X3 [Harmonia axyridis]|uniref:uncharacterized protein LOC123682471 isoform X3 n=1 Tax=Harmonia axyridis TaxID=115357 RepID=UPI001E2798CB|nr:uncharacterized protein LOC123682471 isoform X3 [Harmonia axyridis]